MLLLHAVNNKAQQHGDSCQIFWWMTGQLLKFPQSNHGNDGTAKSYKEIKR